MDALRGLAALAVFLGHWRNISFVDYSSLVHPSLLLRVFYLLTSLGHQSVIVFFVLSGYLVGGSAVRNFSSGWRWSPYLLNRFSRLWIVLFPALAFGCFWDMLGSRVFSRSFLYLGQGQTVIQWHIPDRVSWPIAAGNFFFLQNIRVPTFGSNGPLWSLANEFWYYILFPALLLIASRRTAFYARAGYALLAAFLLWFIGYGIDVLFPVWLMGAALAYAPEWKSASRFRVNLLIGVSAIAAFAVASAGRVGQRYPLLCDLALGVACTVLLWALLQARQEARPSLYRKASHFLASMSYTLYLVHLPLLLFLVSMIHPDQRWQPDRAGLPLLAAVAVFLYSVLLYFCFERNTGVLRGFLSKLLDLCHSSLRGMRRRASSVH
jgi:peptidoglycan/LPS O-acetylase OafA/YrhL